MSYEKKIIYVAHRRESKEILDKLEISLNCKVENKDIPIELYPLIEGSIPFLIIGFCSTSLFTMPLIYGVKIKSIFHKELIENNSRSHYIENIYSLLTS